MNREALIAGFLARHGYAGAERVPLAPDASFRRYLRLSGGPRPALLMDAPPPEDVRPFLRMAAHISAIGLSAPAIIAADEAHGLVLEEDLGGELVAALGVRTTAGVPRANPIPRSPDPISPAHDPVPPGHDPVPPGHDPIRPSHDPILPSHDPILPSHDPVPPPPNPLPQGEGESLTFTLTFPSPSPSASVLASAVDCLIALQRAAPPAGLPRWDATAMAQTALGTLLDWWWPAVFHAPAPLAARDDFGSALAAMLRPLADGARCFVHRDFFAGNLIWLPRREGLRRIGILDFQSAALGHPAYDLASLLQDARQDAMPGMEEQAIGRFLAGRPDLDPRAFCTTYAICVAQRHLRVACQWVRLAIRDKRPHYLAHGPRTWRLLETALRHQAAAPLAAAMDRWIPAALRGNPQGLAA